MQLQDVMRIAGMHRPHVVPFIPHPEVAPEPDSLRLKLFQHGELVGGDVGRLHHQSEIARSTACRCRDRSASPALPDHCGLEDAQVKLPVVPSATDRVLVLGRAELRHVQFAERAV